MSGSNLGKPHYAGSDNMKNASRDLIITMLSSISAPLFAHLLNLVSAESNRIISSDQVIIIYFASVSGYLLGEFSSGLICSKLRLAHHGFFAVFIWCIPVALSVCCFETILGTVVLSVLIFFSLLILYMRWEQITLRPAIFVAAGFIGVLAIYYFWVQQINVGFEIFFKTYLVLFVALLLVMRITTCITKHVSGK